jgi:hypothetical protein
MRTEASSSPALARQILGGLDTKRVGFCPVSGLKPSKDGGYIQLSFDGANKFATLGEVLLWSRGVTLNNVPGSQCSHLCSTPSCTDPNHVVVESAVENNRRKGCAVVWPCSHCSKIYLICSHVPSCIKYIEGYSSWEDFVTNGKHS